MEVTKNLVLDLISFERIMSQDKMSEDTNMGASSMRINTMRGILELAHET